MIRYVRLIVGQRVAVLLGEMRYYLGSTQRKEDSR